MGERFSRVQSVVKGMVSSFLAVCVLCFSAGCGKEKTAEVKALAVKTEKVSFASAAGEYMYSGTVRGRYETNLAFQVGGQVLKRYVGLGAKVKAGDVLLTLDPKDVAEKARQAAAQEDSAAAQLRLAEANLARYEKLFSEGAVAEATLDQLRTARDAASAAYTAAGAAAAAGRNALSYTALSAKADGTVASLYAEEGQVVAAGQPILLLIHDGELEVEAAVPEQQLSDAAVGKEVTVHFWALEGKGKTAESRGVVRELSPLADPLTRTYKMRVSIFEPPEDLQAGMTASVSLASAKREKRRAELPLSAIYQTDSQPSVWVVLPDSTVHTQAVQVVEVGKDTVEVEGLSEGDTVVVAGVHKLHEGEVVRLLTEEKR